MNLHDILRRACQDANAADDREEDYRPKTLLGVLAHELRLRYAKLTTTHEFQPGDLIRAKDGLFVGPPGKRHAIVVDTDPEMVAKRFNESLPFVRPILIAFIDEEGDFIQGPTDAALYEPWTPPALEEI